MSKKFTFNFKKYKKEHLIFIVLIVFAIFFLFNTFKGLSVEKTEKITTNATTEYVLNLENKLYGAVSKIKGVGSVTVKINVSSSFKNVYLTEKIQKTENGQITFVEQPILVGGKTVLIQEEFPTICGVVVVANGSENIMVKTNILNTCITLLGIDSSKIIILNGKK